MNDVFISYSRRDKAFVRALHDALKKLEHRAWVDWLDITPALEWQQEIDQGIETADKFIFVISPDSIASKYCLAELDHAIAHRKQLIPVLNREVDFTVVRPELTQLQIISFCGEDDFATALQTLATVINTDLDHARLFTRLKQRADEWIKGDRHDSFLLRGTELATAEQWLINGANKQPNPSEQHKEFIIASQQWQLQEAQRWKALYEQSEQLRFEAERSEIKALCKSSEALFSSNQIFDALLESLRAIAKWRQATWAKTNTSMQSQIDSALRQAVYGVSEYNRLAGHTSVVWSACFSPDGQTLASTGTDGTINLWKTDGTLRLSLRPKALSRWVRFSPDSRLLASAHEDGSVSLWTLDGTLIHTFTGHTHDVSEVHFSPDGQTLASASYDGTIKVWSLAGILLTSFMAHVGGVTTICFSPDGETISSASTTDNAVRLWSRDGTPTTTLAEEGGTNLSFHPNGQLVAVGGSGAVVRLIRLDGTLMTTLEGHRQQVSSVDFSPDGQTIATASSDGKVILWNLDGKVLKMLHHRSSVNDVNFSPDGQQLVSAGVDSIISLWHCYHPLVTTAYGGGGQWFPGVAFSPTGELLATSSHDGAIILWTPDGKVLATFPGHSGIIFRITFSNDGQFMATAGFDKTVKLWTVDGVLLQTFQHEERAWDVRFSPDDQTLFASGSEPILRQWHREGDLLKTWPNPGNNHAEGVNISGDGQCLIAGTTGGTVDLWTVDGQLITQLQGHARGICSVVFSPDGQTIASASRDNTAKLWNRDGEVLQTLQGHTNWVTDVCFSPDGQAIATASLDQTIRLWTLAGTLLTTLQGHREGVYRVSFSPNGQLLASTSRDGAVMIWNWELTSDQLLTFGSDWVRDYGQTNPNVE
jgi:WD40 repeat protein